MSARVKQNQQTQDKLTRIAIVSSDKCKPKRCRQECKKSCPVVRMGKYILFVVIFLLLIACVFCQRINQGLHILFEGKQCIDVTPESKIAYISESLCIGCGICSKVR